MKKILIIGSTGFIGSYLHKHLSKTHTVYCIDKTNVDVLNTEQVTKFLRLVSPNVVINCLTFGGKENVNSINSEFVGKNLSLFYNFFINSHCYDLYINIGSGAEFDKTKNIDLVKEKDIFESFPKDAYGFAKNLIARQINSLDKFSTLRLFGCFGSNEPDLRLLKKYSSSKDLFALNDRYFDYISIQDFSKIVEFVIENNLKGIDINCVYKDKILLSQFLSLYDQINNRQSNFGVSSVDKLNYTGDSSLLDIIGIDLNGLEHGLREYNV